MHKSHILPRTRYSSLLAASTPAGAPSCNSFNEKNAGGGGGGVFPALGPLPVGLGVRAGKDGAGGGAGVRTGKCGVGAEARGGMGGGAGGEGGATPGDDDDDDAPPLSIVAVGFGGGAGC